MASSWTRIAHSRAAALVVLAVPALAVAVAVWPGHMDADSLEEFAQVKSGVFDNRYSPILQWLWGVAYRAGVGPGIVLVAQILLFCVAAYVLLRLRYRRVAAASLAVLIAGSPPVLGYLIVIGRDAWFTDLALAAFAAAVLAAPRRARSRQIFVAAGFVLAWLGLVTRQNAFTVIVLAVGALIAVGWPGLGGRGARRLLIVGAAACLATLFGYGAQRAAQAGIGVHDGVPQAALYEYDLAGMSHRLKRDLFPAGLVPAPAERTLRRTYEPGEINALATTLGYLSSSQLDRLGESWRRAVTHHPETYAKVRGALLLRQLDVTARAYGVRHDGIDPNVHGFAIRHRRLDGYVQQYLAVFAPDAIRARRFFSVWLYFLAAVLAATWLWRRGTGPSARVAALLGASAVTLQLGLTFGAPAALYRFELLAVGTGLILVALVVPDLLPRRRSEIPHGRPGSPNTDAQAEVDPGFSDRGDPAEPSRSES